jgi:citronellol/citronellal dehydrogenase
VTPSEVFAPDALAGRRALITGGGTGLGKAAAAELVALGAEVVLAGRREEVLREAADALGCEWVAGDIRDDESARAIAEQAGEIDVLINNAGGQYFVPAESIEAKGWQAVSRLNVGGTARMTELLAPAMRERGGGTILNVTLSPHHGLVGMTHSSAARAAVEGLTREWAAAWPELTVVAVAAGHFETEAIQKYPDVVKEGAARSVPMGRLGRPEEHAWLCALLLTLVGRRFSGRTVTLDGARDNWFGPWPPPQLTAESGEVPTEARRPRA